MNHEIKQRSALFLIAILIAGCFGVIYESNFCVAGAAEHEAIQCSAEVISFPSMFLKIDHEGYANAKNWLLGIAMIAIFARGLALSVKKDGVYIWARTCKFCQCLPRSWPNLFLDYPENLVSSATI